MSGSSKFDFYGNTPLNKPRLTYRLLAMALRNNDGDRAATLAQYVQTLLTGEQGGFRRFKFFVPQLLKKLLTPEELTDLEAQLAPRRARASRLKMVFPDVTDEFSLDLDFLCAVLDVGRGPSLPAGGRIFTIGSCFAVNIADYLKGTGHNASSFLLAEDLNSPVSNAFLFDLIPRSPQERTEIMLDWLRKIFPQWTDADLLRVAEFKLAKVDELRANLAQADCVIMTLGNVADFFLADDPGLPLMEKVVPLFAALPSSDEEGRTKAVALLKDKATFRLATTEETREAIRLSVAGIRAATNASIVITLSPVPISAAFSIRGTDARSAPEVDCVSKSRLRSALDDVLPGLQDQYGAISYFPSFEIVRWIAPNLAIPTFGLEDAASRHPSGPVIEAVCSLFVERFLRWQGAEAQDASAVSEKAGAPA